MQNHDKHYPLVWTIASSDSSAGAGIQADIKAISYMGAHAASVVVAVTAQNNQGVLGVYPQEAPIIAAQIQALQAARLPNAIKLGLLPSLAAIDATYELLQTNPDIFVVADPVMAASSGNELTAREALPYYTQKLFYHIDLLTPNLPEAEAILGRILKDAGEIEQGAMDLLEMGVKAVLIKGGHSHDERFVQDFYADRDGKKLWLTGERLRGDCRGTGCTLAAAIAALIARDHEVVDSIVLAKAFVAAAFKSSYQIGAGRSVLNHAASPFCRGVFPWITRTASAALDKPKFADMGVTPIGVYPIVSRSSWIARLHRYGITTMQLRIKDLTGQALEEEIAAASAIARSMNIRLFINDYWELAIKHHAYGVHLGQEDLAEQTRENIAAMAAAGLRLGISTHNYEEAAVAHALAPSYIALGPVFPTTCKSMRFGPRGMSKVRDWVATFDYPIVAIGGLKLEHLAELKATGASGVAVISDILAADNPDLKAKAWVQALSIV